MSISGVTQLFRTIGVGITTLSTWQMTIATIAAAVALPKITKLASGYCRKNRAVLKEPQPFHTWYIEGKQIRFFRENDKIRIEVLRSQDKKKLNDFYIELALPLKDSPMTIKMFQLRNEFELSGWQENNFPVIATPKSEHLHTWILDDQSISLISKEGNLVWKCSSNEYTYWTTVTELPDLDRDERIDTLRTTHQPLKWNQNARSPQLIKLVPSPPWSLGDREISLVIRQDQLFWQLINHTLKTTSWAPLNPDLLKNMSINDRIARLQCQLLDTNRSKIEKSQIEEIVFETRDKQPSRFNYNVKFNKDLWAVTLVDAGQYEICDYTTWGGHAVIVLEGIEENLPFTQASDFLPDKTRKPFGKVLIQEYSPRMKMDYAGKTNTWLVTKNKAQKMINAIRRERDDARNFPVPFDKYGIDSTLSKHPSHNCITWAREKLLLVDIILTSSLLGKWFTAPNFYTN